MLLCNKYQIDSYELECDKSIKSQCSCCNNSIGMSKHSFICNPKTLYRITVVNCKKAMKLVYYSMVIKWWKFVEKLQAYWLYLRLVIAEDVNASCLSKYYALYIVVCTLQSCLYVIKLNLFWDIWKGGTK